MTGRDGVVFITDFCRSLNIEAPGMSFVVIVIDLYSHLLSECFS